MAYKEMFFVQVFEYGPKDRLIMGRCFEGADANEAQRKAQRLADYVPGVIAFSQMVDAQAADSEEPTLLAFYGHVPAEVRGAAA